MCIYGLLSFVLTSLELHTLGNQQVTLHGHQGVTAGLLAWAKGQVNGV